MGGGVGNGQPGSKFKRYNINDLFDEQYGHLQRNEILEDQKQEERQLSQNQTKGSLLNIFIVNQE